MGMFDLDQGSVKFCFFGDLEIYEFGVLSFYRFE